MKAIFTIPIFLLLPLLADAQKKIGRYNNQVVFGIGSSHFSGDVGGSGSILSDSYMNTNLIDTRPSFMFGLKHRLNNYLNLRANMNYFILKANDSHSDNIYKNSRNLSFRSRTFSLNIMGEFYPFGNNQVEEFQQGPNLDFYLFGGIGAVYFNPKAQAENGEWVALQPLGTEGQGLPGEKGKYHRLALVLPYGIGFSKRLNFGLSINFELIMNHVFSDYVDDVSTDYYSEKLLKEKNRLSAFFGNGKAVYSDEMGGTSATKAGMPRGNPENNDAYFFLMFSISKRLAFGIR